MKTTVRVGMILLALVLVASAFAGVPVNTKVMLGLDGKLLNGDIQLPRANELDTEWPDSIYYCDPDDPSSLYTSTNYWSAARFTAPADFQLQGIRFLPLNQYDNFTDECEIWVYSDDDGQPGDDLGGGALWNETLAGWPDWNEVVLDDADYIDIAEGDDFWIIYGPAPGGGYPGDGWWNLVDSAPVPGDRSQMANSREGNYNPINGDLLIIAEGEVSEFFDLVAVDAYNDTQEFFLSVDDEVQFSVEIGNPGNVDSLISK